VNVWLQLVNFLRVITSVSWACIYVPMLPMTRVGLFGAGRHQS